MKDTTSKMGKHRVYNCVCGARPHRPLRADDTVAQPFPKPCDRCDRSLVGRPFMIEDMGVYMREIRRTVKQSPDKKKESES